MLRKSLTLRQITPDFTGGLTINYYLMESETVTKETGIDELFVVSLYGSFVKDDFMSNNLSIINKLENVMLDTVSQF